MNKKIKRIIAFTLMVAAISTVGPSNYINLITTKAYASSSSRAYLNDIDVNHGSLSFSDTKTSYTVKVGSSVDDIDIDVSADSDYEVTIDGHDGKSRNIDLDHGNNSIRIRVKDTTGDKDPITYYLKVIRGSSSSDDDDYDYDNNYGNIYLEDLTLNQGTIDFSRRKSKYTVNVPETLDKIEIKARPEYVGDEVSIDGKIVDEDDNYKRNVSLNQGTNIIRVTVADDNNDDNYRTYTLYINRGTNTTITNSGVSDTEQDSIYLRDLLIDNGNTYLGFTRKVTLYNVNVSQRCDEIIIKAESENSGDVARVNGDKVDSSNKKLVKLNEGKNEIKVKVSNEDDDFDNNRDYDDNYEERTYTINVYRGGGSTAIADSTNITKKADQWINVMGKWQYNDSLGNALVNTWYSDRSNGKVYYLDSQGYMTTGWINPGGSWYYLDENGVRQSGWRQVNGKWYYLDAQGKMLYNTTVGGYKLGYDGAMV